MTVFYKQEIDLVAHSPLCLFARNVEALASFCSPNSGVNREMSHSAFRGVYYVIGTKRLNAWCNLAVLVVLIFLSGFTLQPQKH